MQSVQVSRQFAWLLHQLRLWSNWTDLQTDKSFWWVQNSKTPFLMTFFIFNPLFSVENIWCFPQAVNLLKFLISYMCQKLKFLFLCRLCINGWPFSRWILGTKYTKRPRVTCETTICIHGRYVKWLKRISDSCQPPSFTKSSQTSLPKFYPLTIMRKRTFIQRPSSMTLIILQFCTILPQSLMDMF